MAASNSVTSIDMVVGEDMKGDVYEIVTVNTSGRVVKADASTETVIGVIAEDPGRTTTAGSDSVPVMLVGAGGKGKVKLGGAVTAGDLLVASTTAGAAASGGANVGALANDVHAFGVALETGVSGDVIEFVAMSLPSAANA